MTERAPHCPGIGGLVPSEFTMLNIVELHGPLTIADAIRIRIEDGMQQRQVRKRARLPLYRLLAWELIKFYDDDVSVVTTNAGIEYLNAQTDTDDDEQS